MGTTVSGQGTGTGLGQRGRAWRFGLSWARAAVGVASVVAALTAGPAAALELKPYQAETWTQAQLAGQATALHFHADWCPTCRAQAQALAQLQTKPGLPVTVFVVDYDREKALRQRLGVRSQSFFVVYRGSREVARAGGETAPARIEALLTQAVAP